MGQTFYITVFMSAVALVSSRPERLERKQAVEKVCTTSAKMDVQLIIDSSGSITDTGFHKMMKDIAEKILPNFNIGPEATRVAVFKYSQEHIMVNEFGLNNFSDLPSMQRAVEGIVFQPGQTYTAMAMRKALKAYQEEARSDPGMAKVCMVFTDGIANDESDVPAAHKAWADAGVIVFAVGILEDIGQPVLEHISGSSDRVLRASTIDSIGEITKSLLGQLCKAIEEIDECVSQPCEHGTCIDGVGTYTCECNEDYSGKDCSVQRKWKCARFQKGNQVLYKSVEQCTIRAPGEKCEIKLRKKCPKMPGEFKNGKSYERGIEIGCYRKTCWRRNHWGNYDGGSWGYIYENGSYVWCTQDIDCRFMKVSHKNVYNWKGK